MKKRKTALLFHLDSPAALSALCLFLFLLTGFNSVVWGQGAKENLINYAYLTDFGIGGYDVEERQVRAIQIPFSYQLRPMKKNQWGIKLLFPVSVASVEDDGVDIEGIPLPLDSKLTAVNPGVEVQIPVRPDWAIKPFGKIGIGRDISEGKGALIGTLGVKSRYSFDWGKFQMALGSGIFFDTYKPKDEERKDYASVGIGLDAVYPLWFKLKDRQTNIGGYAAYYNYFDDLEFERLKRPPMEIDDQFEVAMTFGTYQPIRIGWWDLKRVGIAYRFGDGFKGVRLIAGFPF